MDHLEQWLSRQHLAREHAAQKKAWEKAVNDAVAAGARMGRTNDARTGLAVVTLERVPEALWPTVRAVWFEPNSELWICRGPPGYRPPNRAARRGL
jgi:hypothetical protein